MIVGSISNNPFSKQKPIITEPKSIILQSNNNDNPVKLQPMTSRRKREVINPNKINMPKSMSDFVMEELDISWSNDYNIISVHEKIIEFFKSKRNRQSIIESTINAFKTYFKPGMLAEEISDIRFKIKKLREELRELQKLSIMDYSSATSELINEYTELSNNKIIIFGQKETINYIKQEQKINIIDEYFKVAKLFYPIKVQRDVKNTGFCICGGIIFDQGDQNICIECNRIHKKIEIPNETMDLEDYHAPKNVDQRSLEDTILQFQGKDINIIPNKVISVIKTHINSYKGFNIKEMNKQDLYKIMKQRGLGSYYKHINKIHYMLTEKLPPDISQYETNLMKRSDLLIRIFDEIKTVDRSNFLHKLYLMWLFLKNEGYVPNMDDFIMLKGREVELNNVSMLQRGFEILSKMNTGMKWKIYQLR